MATRNFWINAEIDGSKTALSKNPRSKDNSMNVLLTVREDGGIREAVMVTCWSNGEKNIVRVRFNGEIIAEREYRR